MNTFNLHRALCTLSFALGLLPVAGAQVVLFQDDFSGGAIPLNGTTPDVTVAGEVWEAGSTWLANGTANSPIAAAADGQAAHLDFTPVDGGVYTAQATIVNTVANWIGFGFFPDDPAAGDWTQQSFSVRHSNAPGFAWALTRNSAINDQEGFLGGGTAGGQPWNGDVANPANPVTIKVVLDATAANWTAEWFINNVSQGAPVAYGTTGNPGIGGIGFSHDRIDVDNGGGTIDNFSLTALEFAAGDVDLDGDVDETDFGFIRDNFYNTGASRAQGDLDGSGTIDFLDYRIWRNDYPFPFTPNFSEIPEPTSLVIAGMGLCSLLTLRSSGRRRSEVS